MQREVLVARYRRVRYPVLALALPFLFLLIGLSPKGDRGASLPVRVAVTAVLLLPVATILWWELIRAVVLRTTEADLLDREPQTIWRELRPGSPDFQRQRRSTLEVGVATSASRATPWRSLNPSVDP